jgi:hypothetical protein
MLFSDHEVARRARQSLRDYSHRILTIPEWCQLNSFSIATGRRLIKAGKVKVTRLSPRRIGIRADHNAEFQQSGVQ